MKGRRTERCAVRDRTTMDLTPTFGHQELLETLSQKSGSSGPRTAGSGGSQKDRNSSSNSSVPSATEVDERIKYKQVGQRLSEQAHGDSRSTTSQSTHLPVSRTSGFEPYRPRSALEDESQLRSPAPKVAKTRYSDHGEHHPQTESVTILKKITLRAKLLFHLCQANTDLQNHNEVRIRQQSISDTTLSQQQRALSNLDLERDSEESSTSRRWGHGNSLLDAPAKGLLSAVLEGHSDSQTSGVASPSISTKDSKTVSTMTGLQAGSTNGSQSSPLQPKEARGPCLTSPSDPVANDGLDNCEGNMIAHENDVIAIPRKKVHTLNQTDERSIRSSEFKIISLLGQGTFAQVFKCLHIQTGRFVAVKVIKNRAAYTRQAAVEIDVFRALQDDDGKSDVSSGESIASGPKDCTLNLICYFMYHSHLCLVFEMLGLNLYEVLKRRQFRGLPLQVVQNIVKQSLWGVKEVGKKNVVHCDLKPENILLVSDEVGREIIGAGETVSTSADAKRSMSPATTTSKADASGSASETGSGNRSSISGGSRSGGSRSTNSTVQAANIPNPNSKQDSDGKIKLIDFGSACFEGYTAHTYVQSRFYRSPEVLVGLPYDSAIDIWSLGCVAAELFLGLPILPGVHEHDQLNRIDEMLSRLPDWMLEQGSRAPKYYLKFVVPRSAADVTTTPSANGSGSPAPVPQWRMKTQREFIESLSAAEIRKKGGLTKLEKQPGNRYFKRKRLVDILVLQSQNSPKECKTLLPAFVHFIYGMLDPDPWKRWTAFQALQHPFITGELEKLKKRRPGIALDPKTTNQANLELDLHWEPPWDPTICKRKLLNAQKLREKRFGYRKQAQGRSHSLNEASGDRRRSRREFQIGTASSGSFASLSGTLTQESHHRKGDSPPNSLSAGSSHTNVVSSGSTSSASQVRYHSQRDRTSGIAPTYTGSSFPALQNEALRSSMLPEISSQSHHGLVEASMPRPASSFSGHSVTAGGRGPAVEVDFAYALQRPGVVPSSGVDASVASQSSYQGSGSAFSPSQLLQAYPPSRSGSLPQGPLGSLPQGPLGSQTGRTSYGGHASFSGGFPRQVNEVSSVDSSVNFSAPYQMDASVAPSVSSSVTMSEAAPMIIDPHHYPLFHHQHPVYLPQHPIPAGLPQQHQTFNPTSGEIPLNQGSVAPPQDIHHPSLPTNAPILQQQVFMTPAAGPGGGYYYVTTTPNGQPLILQPVGMLNNQPTVVNPQQPFYTDMHAPQQPSIGHPQQMPLHQPQFETHPSHPYNFQKQQHQAQQLRKPQHRPFLGGTSM